MAAAWHGPPRRAVLFAKTAWLVIGCLLMMAIVRYLQFDLLDPATGDVVDTLHERA